MEQYKVLHETVILSGQMNYKGTQVLRYKIEYPRFRSTAFTKAVKRMNLFYKGRAMRQQQYYRQRLYALAVNQYIDSVKNDFPVRMFDAVTAYQLTYNKDCTVSLYTDRYEYTGGAHGNTVRTSETWDLQSGRRLRLDEFFSPPVDVKKFSEKVINKQIAMHMNAGDDAYFANYNENVAEYYNPDSFYLTPIGIILYFQQYEIAPYSSGIPQFLIPFSYGVVLQPECE